MTERLSGNEVENVSTVYIISDEDTPRTLLLKHRLFGNWLPPGGHQEPNENYFETAIRETLEETGIDISPYLPKPKKLDERVASLPLPNHVLLEQIVVEGQRPVHSHQDFVFIVTVPYQEPKKEEGKSDAIGWFTKEEVLTLDMFDNAKTILVDAMEAIISTRNKSG